MITSNVPSPSGSTQATATSHNQFPNQLSSRYPIPPNLLPYNPFLPYVLSMQIPYLPSFYLQAYHSSYPYMLRQWNDPTHTHEPSEFSSPPNPVHHNQQYSVLPSHTNTPILHQNPSLSYEQHPLIQSHSSGSPHPYDHRPSSQPFPLYSSTDPNRVTTATIATSHHSLNPPCRCGFSYSQFSSMTALPKKTPMHAISNSRQPSMFPYHRNYSFYEQSFPPNHPRRSYTSTRNSTITVYHSPAPPLPLATTPSRSGVTASQSTPEHQHPLSPAMLQYVKHLKNVYRKIKTPVYDKENCLLQVKAKSFIKIALVHKDSPKYMKDDEKNEMLMDRLHGHVDAIQEKKTKLCMCDVCKSQDGSWLACSVLVEGAPGVGKTTFAYELCKRWARGELLWEWAAVVLIKLRDHRTRTAQNMYDLLYYPRPEVHKAVVDELIDHDGECMLMILDGYDELTDSQKNSTSVIQQIMSGELLTQSTLMVTSRPLATRTLHDNFVQSIDQHIEVLGFTEKNIDEYIKSACGDKPELVEDFKSYLFSHPFSSALMFNPLQCAIVTDLYRSHWEKGDKGFAPKTLTELYTGLVHIMLLRYLSQHPVYDEKVQKIEDLSDLPEEVSHQLKAVTELAADGIKNQQYVFDEVNTNIPSETLGLMQKEELLTPGIGISTSHNFLHLTLQEYLAAVNYSQQYKQLSNLLTQDDLFPLNNFLQYYGMKREPTLYSSATHWPVILFVAGRTKFSGVPTNIFKIGLHDNDDDDGITTVNVSLLHLLYETQSPQLIQSTLVTSRKYLSVSGSSALDWFVIGYCIANSTSTWRVVKYSECRPKYFDQLVMGLRLGHEKCSGECKIGFLHINGHGNWDILLQLQQYAKKVTELSLVGNNDQWEQRDPEKSVRRSVTDQKVSACYPVLEKCAINDLEISYSASLLSFISQQSNLCILSLSQCNLSSIATSSLIHFLQSPNNRLHKLTLNDCTIQIPNHTNSVAISYQLVPISPTDTRIFSLTTTGSLYAINHMLSQPHLFYANTLTTLKVVIVSETTDSLQIETSFYPHLNWLDINSWEKNNCTLLHHLNFHINSQQIQLHLLSLKRCNLTCETVRSLILSLQSSYCGLQEVTLDDCISDHTHTTTISSKLKLKSLDSGNVSLEFTGDCCDISHWLSQLSSYTKLTDLILHLERQDSTTTDTLQEILLYHHVLESLKIDQSTIYSIPYTITPLPLSIPQLIGSQQDLALKKCTVSLPEDSTQFPHCKLQNLALKKCTISLSEGVQQTKILTKINVALHSLDISWSVLDQMISCINPFTQSLTDLVLHVDNDTHTCTSGVETILQNILSNCPLLKNLKIDCDICISFPLSIPWFIGSQQNNLHTLTLYKCIFSSDVTRSLIHSLQSPHCKLYKLALYYCTIPTTDHTQLTTAIVSSTTITHLLFIDRNIDTPSLTALASGLKHNTTIEQLAVDKFYKYFTEEQFQLLIDAVDSSAVKKLWLNNYYKRWFNSCTLSRKNVKIEWYSYYQYDLYNKW